MVERTKARFDIKPKWLAADTAYGSGPNLNWLVKDKDIAPYIPVIDKSKREDSSLSREDFTFDKERNVYACPQGKLLHTTRSRRLCCTMRAGRLEELAMPAVAPERCRCGPRAYLNKVAVQLNQRPRETLQFATPTESYPSI